MKRDDPLRRLRQSAQGSNAFHFGTACLREQHLPVTGTGDHLMFRITVVVDHKPVVFDFAFTAHALLVGFPAFAVGWIGSIKIKCPLDGWPSAERVRAELHVFCFRTFAFQDKVGLENGVSFRLRFLSIKVNRHLFTVFFVASCKSVSSATVSIPPVPQVPSYTR